MTKQIQKDRYLELDGTPVGAGFLRRLVSPYCLAATFCCSSYGLAHLDEYFNKSNTKEHPASVPFVLAGVGLITEIVSREKIKYMLGLKVGKFDKSLYKKYVIDVRGDLENGAKSDPKEVDSIKNILGYYSLAYSSLAVTATANVGFLMSPFLSPIFYNSIVNGKSYYKLNKGDWVLIPRDDMKKVEEEQKQENHSHTLAPAV